MLHNSFSNEIFPTVPSKPPLAQLEAISLVLSLVTWVTTNTHLATTSFLAFVESGKVSPQPSPD